jgi:ADP-ribose pyrophosphatase YjhB (NUDIX family)
MRRDYYDGEAGAPAPARVVVRVFVMVVDDGGRILAHARDTGPWSLPGGALELGESLEECARREVREETGVELVDLQILTAVSVPDHVIVTDELGPHQQVAVLASARAGGQEPRPSPESPVVRYLAFSELDQVPFDPAQRGYVDAIAMRSGGALPVPAP